jgi:hypothetical protein
VVLRVPRFVVSQPPAAAAARRSAGRWPWHVALGLVVMAIAAGLVLRWQAWSAPQGTSPAPACKKPEEIQTLPPLEPTALPRERTAYLAPRNGSDAIHPSAEAAARPGVHGTLSGAGERQ